MRANAASSPDDSPPRSVTTTATYAGQTFHLFQIVNIRPRPLPGDWPRQWIVIGLDGGVTVATADFNEIQEYTPSSDTLENLTPVAENGTPVYGY